MFTDQIFGSAFKTRTQNDSKVMKFLAELSEPETTLSSTQDLPNRIYDVFDFTHFYSKVSVYSNNRQFNARFPNESNRNN